MGKSTSTGNLPITLMASTLFIGEPEENKRSGNQETDELVRKRGEISEITVGNDVNRLNLAGRNRLVFSSIIAGLIQGLADDLLDCPDLQR